MVLACRSASLKGQSSHTFLRLVICFSHVLILKRQSHEQPHWKGRSRILASPTEAPGRLPAPSSATPSPHRRHACGRRGQDGRLSRKNCLNNAGLEVGSRPPHFVSAACSTAAFCLHIFCLWGQWWPRPSRRHSRRAAVWPSQETLWRGWRQ